jgi:hypothetical protein
MRTKQPWALCDYVYLHGLFASRPTAKPRKGISMKRHLIAGLATLIAPLAFAASAPRADAQPPGTLCGHVQNRVGVSLPVIVLNGDVDCATAVNVAADYLRNPPSGGGTLMLENVDGWTCDAPLLPGRSHADSYLECDQASSGFKIGN